MNKKYLVAFGVLCIMCAAIFAGCGKTSGGVYVNSAYNDQQMKTIQGETIDYSKQKGVFELNEAGFALLRPQSWNDINRDSLAFVVMEQGIYLTYCPESVLKKLAEVNFEKMTDDEISKFYDEFYSECAEICCIYVDRKDNQEQLEKLEAAYDTTEIMAENGNSTYYVFYNNHAAEGFLGTDAENIKTLVASMKDIKAGLILFPTVDLSVAENFGGNLRAFTAEDMDGTPASESIFSEHDITMVNVWTTWCGYCIEEMPELETLYKQLPENVNLISICADAADEPDLAKDILSKSGVTFQTLIGSDTLNESFLKHISSFPTTVFVDKTGTVVGTIQLGAPVEIVPGYMALIEEALSIASAK